MRGRWVKLGRWKNEPPEISKVDLPIYIGDKQGVLSLDTNAPLERYILECTNLFGTYEPEATEVLRLHLREGDQFVDLGAHVGYFSLVGSMMVGPSGKVFAFEPYDRNYRRLVMNTKRLGNVATFHFALSDAAGFSKFFFNVESDGCSSFWNPIKHPWSTIQPEEVEIECRRLDDCVTLPIRGIKIDVEGAEVQVLRGAPKLLASPELKFVIAERNDFGLKQMGSNAGQIVEILTENGFQPQNRLEPQKSAGGQGIIENFIFVRK